MTRIVFMCIAQNGAHVVSVWCSSQMNFDMNFLINISDKLTFRWKRNPKNVQTINGCNFKWCCVGAAQHYVFYCCCCAVNWTINSKYLNCIFLVIKIMRIGATQLLFEFSFRFTFICELTFSTIEYGNFEFKLIHLACKYYGHIFIG